MKYRLFLFITAILSFALFLSCQSGWDGEERDFRQDMRNFVQSINTYSHSKDSDFIIIPQNGHALLTNSGLSSGTSDTDYIAAIDGVGREDLFYGYNRDNEATPPDELSAMLAFMNLAEANGVQVLTTDYCSTAAKADDSYAKNAQYNFISFATDSRDLDTIPSYPLTPYNVHNGSVTNLSEAKNFLYLLDPSRYSTKSEYLSAIDSTNFDLIIMDLFFEDNDGNITALTSADLTPLRTKANGGSRLLICYMSIGEAEDYRFYWDDSWKIGNPEWLTDENPSWPGNYKVEYWNPNWQAVIFGSSGAYLDKIINVAFDGVYLDIIDAYEFFEDALDL